jgi:hypothetical protein
MMDGSGPILTRKDLLKNLEKEITDARGKSERKLGVAKKIVFVYKLAIHFLHIVTICALTFMVASPLLLNTAASIVAMISHSVTFLLTGANSFLTVESTLAEVAHTVEQLKQLDRDLKLTLSRNHLSAEQIEICYEETISRLALIESQVS